MSDALLARDLVRTLGTRRVLDGVTLTAAPGRRIGLIGENGAGKSTLLRLLAGVDQPDSGTVVRPADLGFLRQELPFDGEATVADVLDDALREARADLAELDRLTRALAGAPDDAALLEAYGARLDQAQQRESWDADRRAEIVLDRLGLGGVPRSRALASLSGGQRGRLALAALLIRRPAALLLDEPTNHLDDDAAVFVEEQLRGMAGVVVVASHDRAFLDAVCTDLVDLDPAVDGPVRYGGGYGAYLAEKRAERERWEQRHVAEQAELGELRRAVAVTARRVAPDGLRRDNEKMGYGHRGGRVQSQISRRVRNAARRLAELERDQVPPPPAPLRFHAPALTTRTPQDTAPDLITCAPEDAAQALTTCAPEDVAPALGARPPQDAASVPPLLALRDVRVPGRLAIDRLDVSPGERLLVTGPNGAGKSTLLAVLAGRLDAEGEVRRRRGLTVGLLAQDTVFERPDRTVRETYELALGAERAESVPLRSLGLIGRRDVDLRVGELSVGQRRRLALALLVADPPEVLLLDEPTNHLSPRLSDELEEAMGAAGPGAIVIASHDRWLRARWQGRHVRLGDS
ncbi:ABC-F family ATP-binding cassette domain-containing protein [Nonomuraea angiospora]|uniref:Macrolide transport system ATP-binding/permease protein n=1 Tax=Nonomuraea angiospora TaxID=46172 RepID=A0ABR9LX03_9ACTN|nr:ABC-F family ATP-binding cassette domain-containing protein [Nonomuraea angiospora]MBE1585174.1 macrolide transport system ATP-binding/permease protein [Nonomuraea angiospora]